MNAIDFSDDGPRDLNDYDKISISQIVIYSLFLLGGIVLCFRHGFSRGSGWFFLIILALARLIGASLYLATIHFPANSESLYIGWLTCTGISLSPLILLIHGLLGRVFNSVRGSGPLVLTPRQQRLISLLMLVGLILIIVGNNVASYTVTGGHLKVTYPATSKAGMAIVLAVYVIVAIECLLAFRTRDYIAEGEHRLVLVCIAAMPFILVRAVYGGWTILGNNTAGFGFYLAASVIMEIIVMAMCEIVGFSIPRAALSPEDVEQGPGDAYGSRK